MVNPGIFEGLSVDFDDVSASDGLFLFLFDDFAHGGFHMFSELFFAEIGNFYEIAFHVLHLILGLFFYLSAQCCHFPYFTYFDLFFFLYLVLLL